MKITAIKSFVCNARMRNWIFVKVETDQPGLIGWGEATLEWHTRSVVGAIEDLATLLIGEDPRRIEHLWQMMFRQHFWHSSGIVRATAMSGIDIALWDIAGKALGRAVPPLVGRPGARLHSLVLPSGRRTDGGLLRNAGGQRGALRRARARGGGERIHGLQVDGGSANRPARGDGARAGRRAGRRAHARGRRPRIDIMVDCHARPSPAMGMLFAKALEPYRLFFLEEPCWPENVESLSHINASVSTPIATGERLTNLANSADLFAARGCEIVQLDITHCGGLIGGKKDRSAGRSASDRLGAAQSTGTRQHRGLVRTGFRAAGLRDLRDGERGCPVARRSRAGPSPAE